MTSNINPTEISVTVDNISLEFSGTFIIHYLPPHQLPYSYKKNSQKHQYLTCNRLPQLSMSHSSSGHSINSKPMTLFSFVQGERQKNHCIF
jgi:hypothetical protein